MTAAALGVTTKGTSCTYMRRKRCEIQVTSLFSMLEQNKYQQFKYETLATDLPSLSVVEVELAAAASAVVVVVIVVTVT